MKERVTEAVDTARPYVERLAKDQDVHEHVRNAYFSARKIYDELIGPSGPTAVALRVARDKEIQEDLRQTIEELREAARHARGDASHTGRNMTLLLVGVTLGVLFNPMTGPDTRRWVREKMFGPEEPFEFQSSTNQS
jgi:hypothetical protein